MAEIPVFKERRMTGTNLATQLDSSYYISDSFAGILRLSPNNNATLLDINNSIDITSEIENYINFSDSVSALLEKQFITVSTSDGVLLDMRIFNDAVEYSNLYIKGAISIPNAVIYTGKDSKFTLGNVNMPITYNPALPISDAESEYTAPTTDDIEDTYILVNVGEDENSSRFEYKTARELIGGFVGDALTKLSALPTGSIHWIPVNIQQYQELLNVKNNGRNNHNSSDPTCNSLIRDFLLCDGSEYNNRDFPELAKILYKETVNYWKPSGELMKMSTRENLYDGSKTFRVPDLRSMFIQYIIPQIEKINDTNNKVGAYEVDSPKNQEISVNNAADKHYHYIVLDNSIKSQSNTVDWNASKKVYELPSSVKGVDEWGLPKFAGEPYGKPLAKYGSTRRDGGEGIKRYYRGGVLTTKRLSSY